MGKKKQMKKLRHAIEDFNELAIADMTSGLGEAREASTDCGPGEIVVEGVTTDPMRLSGEGATPAQYRQAVEECRGKLHAAVDATCTGGCEEGDCTFVEEAVSFTFHIEEREEGEATAFYLVCIGSTRGRAQCE